MLNLFAVTGIWVLIIQAATNFNPGDDGVFFSR
jgi:hypothetical protein